MGKLYAPAQLVIEILHRQGCMLKQGGTWHVAHVPSSVVEAPAKSTCFEHKIVEPAGRHRALSSAAGCRYVCLDTAVRRSP